MARKETPKDTNQEAVQEAAPDKSAPITFVEPISADDQVAVVSDSPTISDAELAELQRQADMENEKRDFTLAVLKAREPVEVPVVPAPVAPRIAAQTAAEMEAGRKMNEHHAKIAVRRPPPEDQNTGTTAVFRPGDYVPDQKKGQGNIQARDL